MTATHNLRWRRGTIGISMLLVMLVLDLVVVGAVVAGARDQDMSVQRLDSSRALYAAEAGMNMGIREVMDASDEDGDGGVGSISADSNPANDPGFGSARVVVLRASGSNYTITSQGRSGAARRTITLDVQ